MGVVSDSSGEPATHWQAHRSCRLVAVLLCWRCRLCSLKAASSDPTGSPVRTNSETGPCCPTSLHTQPTSLHTHRCGCSVSACKALEVQAPCKPPLPPAFIQRPPPAMAEAQKQLESAFLAYCSIGGKKPELSSAGLEGAKFNKVSAAPSKARERWQGAAAEAKCKSGRGNREGGAMAQQQAHTCACAHMCIRRTHPLCTR